MRLFPVHELLSPGSSQGPTKDHSAFVHSLLRNRANSSSSTLAPDGGPGDSFLSSSSGTLLGSSSRTLGGSSGTLGGSSGTLGGGSAGGSLGGGSAGGSPVDGAGGGDPHVVDRRSSVKVACNTTHEKCRPHNSSVVSSSRRHDRVFSASDARPRRAMSA